MALDFEHLMKCSGIHHKELDQLKTTSAPKKDMKLSAKQVYPEPVHNNTVQEIIILIVHKTVFGAYYHNHLTASPVLWSLWPGGGFAKARFKNNFSTHKR